MHVIYLISHSNGALKASAHLSRYGVREKTGKDGECPSPLFDVKQTLQRFSSSFLFNPIISYMVWKEAKSSYVVVPFTEAL